MGGRGASSGAAKGGARTNYSLSESIKNEFINKGLNSNIAGIRKKAEEGTGNYAFKNASAVSADTIDKVGDVKFHENNGNTLVEGYLENGRHVFYANKSDSPEIQRLRAVQTEKKEKNAEIASYRPDFDFKGRETTTYDRWYKNNVRKVAERMASSGNTFAQAVLEKLNEKKKK